MKIIYFITTPDRGGAQTHLLDLVSGFKDSNDILVVTSEEGFLTQELQKLNVRFTLIDALQRDINLAQERLVMTKLNEILNQERPDLLHCHSSKAGILGRLSANKQNIPVVFTVHGWSFENGIAPLRRLVFEKTEQWVGKRVPQQMLITVSEASRQLGLKAKIASEDRIVTIHNGISPEAPVWQDTSNDPVKLIMVARYSEQKDQRLLISTVAKAGLNAKISLIGDGPYYKDVQDWTQKQGYGQVVEFLGERSDVAELLVSSDIFVLTSMYEGFPISILEAMRAGLPVVASDVGGVNEAVIEGKTGYLIPRSDANTLEARLRQLVENPDLRQNMGRAGREMFLKNFTQNAMLEKTQTVYDQALSLVSYNLASSAKISSA